MKTPTHPLHAAVFSFLLAACGDDVDAASESTTHASSGSGSTDSGAPASSGESETSSSAGSDDGDAETTTAGDAVEIEVVAAFDPGAFELPEGLVLDGDDAIVGFAFTGAVERVGLTDGARAALARTPAPPPDTSFVTGIGLDGDGVIHAAVASFTADLAPGIYRAPATGGDAELWAADPAMVFPNGLTWADDGTLYVTDSAYGGVFVIDAQGLVAPWIQDPRLAGDPTSCDAMSTLSVGANGVAWVDGALLVAGNDMGVLLRIPIAADGSAGTPEALAGPDCALAGIDGIAVDDDGSVVAAINRSDRVVRIGADGTIDVIAEGPPLDFPASVAFGEDRSLYVTNFALAEFSAMGAPTPALLRVTWP